jgi:hypothetical protein
MARWVTCLALLVAVIGGGADARAQTRAVVRHDTSTLPAVVTTSATIQASLDRINRGSPSWRDAVTGLVRLGSRILVVTPDRVVVADEVDQPVRIFDRTVLAEVARETQDVDGVPVLLVVVNVPLLTELHRERRSQPREFEADLDRVLAHEVYGHAFPYLLAGDESGRCADPKKGQRASEACSIRRENVVREELGLGRRTDPGVASLALARGLWAQD